VRRRAQLLHHRPDLRIVDLRGNVDTRLAKLDTRPEWTAIVLAAAGLVRLGLTHRIGERLEPQVLLPAPGQGALAVTVRTGDQRVASAVRKAVHDPSTALQVAAERAFLHALEGGCQVPVAAYADLQPGAGNVLRLRGRIVSRDGKAQVDGSEAGPVPQEENAVTLGVMLADRLLNQGGRTILEESRTTSAPAIPEP
jgi:hydroxymethylbilane synthase